MSSDEPVVYVVTIDSREEPSTSSIFGYKEETTPARSFEDKIVKHPKIMCHKSRVAELCGLNLKLYYMKCKKGLAQYHRESGLDAAMRVMASDPFFLANNNGIASWLTIDPAIGLPEWTVTGKAYVVLDDGRAPLSKGQVWGIQEMIHCSMDIYDVDPENIRAGHEAINRWADGYRKKTWVPRSGLGGMDIYSMRRTVTTATDTTTETTETSSTAGEAG